MSAVGFPVAPENRRERFGVDGYFGMAGGICHPTRLHGVGWNQGESFSPRNVGAFPSNRARIRPAGFDARLTSLPTTSSWDSFRAHSATSSLPPDRDPLSPRMIIDVKVQYAPEYY